MIHVISMDNSDSTSMFAFDIDLKIKPACEFRKSVKKVMRSNKIKKNMVVK